MPESAPIPYGGPRTFESYRKAQWFHLRRALRTILVLWAVFALVLLIALVTGATRGSLEDAVPILIVFAVITGFLGLMELSIRRSWKSNKAIHEAVQGAFTDECLETQSAIGSSKMPWSYFLKWASSEKVLLLYQADNCVNILTRDLFATEDDWRRALELVAGKVPKRAKGSGRQLLWRLILWLAVFGIVVYMVMR